VDEPADSAHLVNDVSPAAISVRPGGRAPSAPSNPAGRPPATSRATSSSSTAWPRTPLDLPVHRGRPVRGAHGGRTRRHDLAAAPPRRL